ncbi:GMC oxidoreductase-domain-containing protein [Crepidotus variabilis]|uniref:pyranose dehydrogenase (acceptor) n=1 Tax=Crepidotus variabilis TaxID=179855 RepID=A0A9P6E5R6_9AGAR|nr:GMC oxidoreductase-domain-containing protein [Crepidotus variabilis]
MCLVVYQLRTAFVLFGLYQVAGANFFGSLEQSEVSEDQILKSYDYIIAGGGQSGLVIANRLSEDVSKTVLVVEYGYFNRDPSQLDPLSGIAYLPRYLFNYTTVPQQALSNRTSGLLAASAVGGGSTLNGMLFDRAAAEDYDNWERLGNPGWGWEGLLPYFKKSTTFTPPRVDLVEEFNITWNVHKAYGSGPIQVTFPDWQWPTLKTQWRGWDELGVPRNLEGNGGDAYGTFWVPTNNDQSYRRSFAVNAYYDPIHARPNLHLITGYRVNKVIIDDDRLARAVQIQERKADGVSSRSSTIIQATKEIVLCSGWLNTPLILQRSGVGPASLLKKAGVDVVVDLPGVGSNLQDHPALNPAYEYHTDLIPNERSLYTNATFAQWADEQWTQRKGPHSLGVGNALADLPLRLVDEDWSSTLAVLQAQDPSTYLPKHYVKDQIDGYNAQTKLLRSTLSKLNNGAIEIPFTGVNRSYVVLEKPFSRGNVLINTTDLYGAPTIDYQTNFNPVDVKILIAALRTYRKWHTTPSMMTLTPVEIIPGANITTDQDLSHYIARSIDPTSGHSCGTASMAPRKIGGVVSPDLTVYGVKGLSVGDISIIPMIPGTHTCSTVYAIAEKAADLIKSRNIY